jgi:hypothetical protein
MDDQDPQGAFLQDPRTWRMTQVATHETRQSTFWEFLMTGRTEQKRTTSTVVPMLR